MAPVPATCATTFLVLIKEVADGEGPARDDILTVEHVIYAQNVHRPTRPMHGDRLAAWIDDEHEPGAVFKPLGDLLVDLGVKVVGRDHLDGEVRGATKISSNCTRTRKPITPHERHVRCADCVWL